MKKLCCKGMKIFAASMVAILTFGMGVRTLCAEELSDDDTIDSVTINSKNFPDSNFRSYISSSFDRNGDNILDADEIIYIRNIWCNNMGIKSVKGIEYLTELRGIYCMDNQISSWDLSKNTQLTGIWCSGNKFTSLDFSCLPELVWVYCFDCQLTSLNVSNNPKMAYIECNTNPLTKLDVTHNPELEHLMCGSCELTELDLSHNPKLCHLDAFRNHFTSLDVTHNPLLKRLDVWDNRGLGSIDVSHCPGLQTYNCAHNDATTIDVTHNPNLEKLICSYNDLTSLDLTHNPKLAYLDCACNELTSLNLSNNTELFFLQAFTNKFSSLDINNNRYLKKTYRDGQMKYEPNVGQVHSWTIDYGYNLKFFICFDDGVSIVSDGVVPEKPGDNATLPNPEEYITRDALVQVLYELAGSPSVSGSSRFTDVPGSPYEKALIWAEKNKILMGYPDICSDKCGVGCWTSRQDMAFMLMRYAEYKNYSTAFDYGRTDEYMDYYDIDFYAWDAVTWAIQFGMLEGKGPSGAPLSQLRIDPHGRATRYELIHALEDMLQQYDPKVPVPTIPISPSQNPGTPSFADFIDRMYRIALLREPEQSGKAFWMNKVKNEGFTGGRVAIGFLVEAKEFLNRDLSNDQFIDTLYQIFFDRAPDDTGKAFWLQKFAEGMTREQMVYGFIDSAEWCNLCANYGIKSGAPNAKAENPSNNALKFADRLYHECLGRDPEEGGLQFWALRLTNLESSGYEAAYGFFTSDEFKQKGISDDEFIHRLYRTFMGRDEDASGFAFWKSHLGVDMSREDLIKGFAQSTEFTNICNEYSIDKGI